MGAAGHRQNHPGDSDRQPDYKPFETLSAMLADKPELREVINKALERRCLYQKKTTLFVKDVLQTLN